MLTGLFFGQSDFFPFINPKKQFAAGHGQFFPQG
jgi:hypothetical protein